VFVSLSQITTKTHKMTTRKEIITALDFIELQLKSFSFDADNNGNSECNESYNLLIEREDSLMVELLNFPL
jgi:hypothetical protein